MRVKFEQGSPGWRAWRREGLGGSDIGVIMGTKAFGRTLLSLYNEKVEGIESFVSSAMQKGIDYEREARLSYEELTGNICEPACFQDDDVSYFRSSLDGITMDGKRSLEIKVPGQTALYEAKQGRISQQYFYQCQWNMARSKTEVCDFYVYDKELKIGYLMEIKADPDIQAEMEFKAHDYWNAYIVKREAPEVPKLPLFKNPECFEKEKIVAHALEMLNELSFWEKVYEKEKKELCEMTNNSSARGNLIQLKVTSAKGNIDYKCIPELQGVDLEQYRKAPIQKSTIDLL